MSAPAGELFFLLDARGSFIVFQENESAWVGLLAFSSEERAHAFAASSHLEVSDIAALDPSDRQSLAALIDSVKKRAVRNLLLDLDYRTGACAVLEFEGSGLGPSRPWQFTPRAGRR